MECLRIGSLAELVISPKHLEGYLFAKNGLFVEGFQLDFLQG